MYVSISYIYMVHRDLCSAHSTTLTDVAAVSLNCFSQCALQQQHYFHDLTFFKKPTKKQKIKQKYPCLSVSVSAACVIVYVC